MTNRLTNAGFLELTSGWGCSAGLALSADEAVRGAPGRIALLAKGATTAPGQTLKLWAEASRRPVITSGTVEVSGAVAGFVAGVAVSPVVRVVFRDGAGLQTGVTSASVQPAALPVHGEGLAGLRDAYRRFWVRTAVPAGTATVDVDVGVTTTTAAPVEIALLKPFVGVVPAGRSEPMTWDPGLHINADLALGAWPQVLRPFQIQSRGEPQPGRIEFQAGSGRPASRRTAYDPARRFKGSMRCDAVQRSVLETFWREGPSDFWFVEPDSDRLCVASRAADGAPVLAEARGSTSMIEVGLWLETA